MSILTNCSLINFDRYFEPRLFELSCASINFWTVLSFPSCCGVLNIETGDHVTGPASYDTIKLPEHNSRWVPQLQKGIGQCKQHLHPLNFAASNPPTHWSIHPWIHQNPTKKNYFFNPSIPCYIPAPSPIEHPAALKLWTLISILVLV
jgi:hypothetical protein